MGTVLAAMQPYFIPHKDYFDLVENSDLFVLLDSMPISNRKWVKGNYFVLEQQRKWINIPLNKHGQQQPISTLKVHESFSKSQLLRRFEQSKGRDPGWPIWKDVLEEYLNFYDDHLITGLILGFDAFVEAASIRTEWHRYSDLKQGSFTSPSARMANLCHSLGATTYLNNATGMHLYDEREFHSLGVELRSFSAQESHTPEYLDESLSYLEDFIGGETAL